MPGFVRSDSPRAPSVRRSTISLTSDPGMRTSAMIRTAFVSLCPSQPSRVTAPTRPAHPDDNTAPVARAADAASAWPKAGGLRATRKPRASCRAWWSPMRSRAGSAPMHSSVADQRWTPQSRRHLRSGRPADSRQYRRRRFCCRHHERRVGGARLSRNRTWQRHGAICISMPPVVSPTSP